MAKLASLVNYQDVCVSRTTDQLTPIMVSWGTALNTPHSSWPRSSSGPNRGDR